MSSKKSYLNGMVAERDRTSRMTSIARGALVDRGEHGLMVADEALVVDEVKRGRPPEAVVGRRDEAGDRRKADPASLALRKKGRREGEWAQKEQRRWPDDCGRTWKSVLKVVVQREVPGHEVPGSLLVRLEEDEGLRYGILRIEALSPVRLSKW